MFEVRLLDLMEVCQDVSNYTWDLYHGCIYTPYYVYKRYFNT